MEQYGLVCHKLKTHYNPLGVVDKYYKKFHTYYKYNSFGAIKRYKNIHLEIKIQNILVQNTKEEKEKQKKEEKDRNQESLPKPNIVEHQIL